MTLPGVPNGTRSRRLLISAFGIHVGGGLVLLDALLSGATADVREALIDARAVAARRATLNGMEVRSVPRSFRSRLLALTSLARRASADDILLCFNSLPPLIRSKAYVVTYVQAPHFIGAHAGITYPARTRLRQLLERLWFRLGLRNSDEIWVQTESMARAVETQYPGSRVRIAPLVDATISSSIPSLKHLPGPSKSERYEEFSFFYPADAVGHKNHARLLLAWQQLARKGIDSRLLITLRTEEISNLTRTTGVAMSDLPNVQNLGRLTREQVLTHMYECNALMFPSLAETFGLPLLEARMLGKPILAAERDFVRDVCVPTETFDPESTASIVRAVERFLAIESEPANNFQGPKEFVEQLLQCSATSRNGRHEANPA